MAETIRMNISIPVELKREMDGIKESVNWSSIAAEAFRRRLLELASTRKGKTMRDVIERLKVTDELAENEAHQDGKRAGEEWAKSRGTAWQLRRLFQATSDELFTGSADAFGWGGVLYQIIKGKRFDDRSSLNEFWEVNLGEDAERIDDIDFASAFAEGAVEVWEAAMDAVDGGSSS